MSTALPEPLHLIPSDASDAELTPQLESVAQQTLTINEVASPVGAHATAHQALVDPAKQYMPDRIRHESMASSNVLYLPQHRDQELADRRHHDQSQAIKHMTQTIGAAFVEAELGVRPFTQLSSWIELELFQKLRARVQRTVSGNYLTAQCNAPGDTTVPSVTPIGVRATVQDDGDWETSMTIRVGRRARAIAMRLRLHRERWKVTAFEIG